MHFVGFDDNCYIRWHLNHILSHPSLSRNEYNRNTNCFQSVHLSERLSENFKLDCNFWHVERTVFISDKHIPCDLDTVTRMNGVWETLLVACYFHVPLTHHSFIHSSSHRPHQPTRSPTHSNIPNIYCISHVQYCSHRRNKQSTKHARTHARIIC